MISAFCPSHITCFFEPVDSADIMQKGSRGAGIRLDKGSTVSISENRSSNTVVTIDGVSEDALVTRKLLEMALPGRGFDVIVENGLPVGQGFGMSASGAIAVALCAAEVGGFGEWEAYSYAHRAEVMMGGGLGDVSAIMSNEMQPVRVRPGLPPTGEVVGTDVDLSGMSVAVIGPKMKTSGVLNDSRTYKAICDAGRIAVDDYLTSPSKKSLYDISNRFSASIGLQSVEMDVIMDRLHDSGVRSGMCMLGNSVFIDADATAVSQLLDDVSVFSVNPTREPASIIRKG